MMQFLWLYIDELVGKGLSLGVIFEFLGWGSATLIPLALPLATLLASIMTMGSFGENNELLAMKAAGISLPRIISPLIIVSVFISIGAFFVSNNLIPLAFNNIYTLRADISKTKEEIKIPTGIFYNGIENYSLRIDSRDKADNMLYNLMIYDHSLRRGNVRVTLADSGLIRFSSNKKNLVFTLYSGYTYDEGQRNYGDTLFKMQKIAFSKQEIVMSLENYAFQRSNSGQFRNEIMSQDLKRLRVVRDSLDSVYTKVKAYQIKTLYQGGGFTFSKQLDTSLKDKFSNDLEIDSLFNWRNLEEQKNAYLNATSLVQNAITIIQGFEMEEHQHVAPLRKVKIEWFRKFTLSLACFIFFFIGAPIGAIIRKGGLGMPVIISLFFFVLYWVIDISGKKLATDGAISPAMGTLISTFILMPIGIFLTWKSTKDSSIFNIDSYIMIFKKGIKRLKSFNSTYNESKP